MSNKLYLLLAVLVAGSHYVLPNSGPQRGSLEYPRIVVGIIARNTAHTLPNFFGYLENLDYPKDRMVIWVRTAPSVDDSQNLVVRWAENVRQVYESVSYSHEERFEIMGDVNPFEATDEWYEALAQLRQEGLDHARLLEADYLLWMDCDNFLVNNQTLKIIMEQQKPLISPMLECGLGMAFSNFWCGQDERGYYKRTPEYMPTLHRKRIGCFQVPVIYGTVLMNLRDPATKNLAYWPAADGFKGPVDDTIQFAFSARIEGVGMFVLNSEVFGYIIRPEYLKTAEEHASHFLYFKLKTLVNHPPVPVSQYLSLPEPVKDTVGVDRIYMISLERRPERRNRMLACLNELQLDITLFNAIDGRLLNVTYLDSLGIHYLPGWKDPWGERPMTFGEVGCFLSHYFIWQQMVEEDLQEVLVLEDDIDFEKGFRESLQRVLSEARQLTPTWDLIYVGRKIMDGESEAMVKGASMLVTPKYSYWTLGYLISLRGVKKLLDARPFDNLLPVDEFLPIMFDVHPQKSWAANFPVHNLEAYSAYPLLINPTHYAGDKEWFSDTEPPEEILEQIRKRKVREEKEMKEAMERQKKIKQDAINRQIQTMKDRLKSKTEL